VVVIEEGKVSEEGRYDVLVSQGCFLSPIIDKNANTTSRVEKGADSVHSWLRSCLSKSRLRLRVQRQGKTRKRKLSQLSIKHHPHRMYTPIIKSQSSDSCDRQRTKQGTKVMVCASTWLGTDIKVGWPECRSAGINIPWLPLLITLILSKDI
jgi:hypothetical protein